MKRRRNYLKAVANDIYFCCQFNHLLPLVSKLKVDFLFQYTAVSLLGVVGTVAFGG